MLDVFSLVRRYYVPPRYNRYDSLIVFLSMVLFFPNISSNSEAILHIYSYDDPSGLNQDIASGWTAIIGLLRELTSNVFNVSELN